MNLNRQPVFTTLTRPQMFAGVTYSYFILNGVISTEAFLVTKSFWAIGIAIIVHLIGYFSCLREPRFFDLWLTKVAKTPRIPNWKNWGCNSYGS